MTGPNVSRQQSGRGAAYGSAQAAASWRGALGARNRSARFCRTLYTASVGRRKSGRPVLPGRHRVFRAALVHLRQLRHWRAGSSPAGPVTVTVMPSRPGAPLALAQGPERQPDRDHDGQRAQRHPLEEHPGHAPAGPDRVRLAEQGVDRSRPQQGDHGDNDEGLGDDHREPRTRLPAGHPVGPFGVRVLAAQDDQRRER